MEARLAPKPDRGPFGAFDQGTLVGLVALGRENMDQLAHKALIWGKYVIPAARGTGIGRALLLEALQLARSVPSIRQVHLSVTAANAGAIGLYQSVGFTSFGLEPDALCVDGQFHDTVHMALRLADRPASEGPAMPRISADRAMMA
ncbi:MAG: GNAT family protein [Pseudomonadota bacterium]